MRSLAAMARTPGVEALAREEAAPLSRRVGGDEQARVEELASGDLAGALRERVAGLDLPSAS